MTQEQLRQEDRTRAKRKREESDELGLQPTIVLGHARIKTISIASLPPVLKKRFIHPGGECHTPPGCINRLEDFFPRRLLIHSSFKF